MTVDSEYDRDDELLSELLKPLDADAAPVDHEFLLQLQRQSMAQFLKVSPESADSTHGVSAHDSVTISSSRDRIMFSFTARLAVSVSAACIAGVAWLAAWFGATSAVGSVTLDDVIRQAVQSETLQLKVVRHGTEADVWVRKRDDHSTDVRWEESPSLYRIAHGSRLWEIDEENNTVKSAAHEWLNPDGNTREVDLLAMLGIEESASQFRKVRAVGHVKHADRNCRVFRMITEQDDRKLLIEAFADAETNDLLMIAAWPDGLRNARKAPLAELRLIARNKAVDESRFVVAKSLSSDGRIGRVLDAQGIVTLRPVMRSRWTPVARQMLIRPGDWLRTDVRGANAAELAMTSQFKVVAGPGTLVEIQNPGQIFLHGGEVQITGSDHSEDELTLLAPNKQKVVVKAGEQGLFRLLADRSLRRIDQKPIWLAGFEGSSNEESIGSLIANIDGRNVPLTVGYHKVSVEIRDQIARTTIEESFVNRTNGRLEGVFHFPLPQDASISGFGMWIGNELVEADVVEKQRAREIYETILRERRDPGLLEWTGGNIFKARVFPIEPHSEKRIRIVYTQVLPLRANKYRYSYALRSELLQKTPLRELSINVLVNSELPLRSVTCPTHSVRSSFGGPVGGGGGAIRSAQLEFAAQEYSPTRDFEVVCEVDSKQSDVVVIPHQRGGDGYFLAQVSLPGADGNWQREVLPDGDPLEVLLVCDTSASMDSDSRKKQNELVAAILSSLGPKDRFNLAVCDVDCHWLFEESVDASVENEKAITKARQWLSNRTSLGWTDLVQAFASVGKRAKPGSHVIYIGDGIVTAGNADPQAFASRVERLFNEESKRSDEGEASPTFHAVSVSSSFESVVLKAIAGIGGGSVRAIGGERTPQSVAFELLNEIAQPGLRDVEVEFRGLQVAAVYPEKLPNLAAGTQQIIVGRYLPTGDNQTGEMIVTGNRGGEPVRYAARVQLKGAENSNSFIPRLWARAHLDQLLQQGTSELVKDEIIGLSEEFHIITPYTSLLVLESDADRERFGVTRRYKMRDGERFFAEAKDNARFELRQRQMKRAGDWRLNLRRAILSKMAGLGRSTQAMQSLRQMIEQKSLHQPVDQLEKLIMVSDGTMGVAGLGGGGYGPSGSSTRALSFAGASTYGFVDESGGRGLGIPATSQPRSSLDVSGDLTVLWDLERDPRLGDLDEEFLFEGSDGIFADSLGISDTNTRFRNSDRESGQFDSSSRFVKLEAAKPASGVATHLSPFLRGGQAQPIGLSQANVSGAYFLRRSNAHRTGADSVSWVRTLFPSWPSSNSDRKASDESTWPDEAIEISRSLLQPDALSGQRASLEIRTHSESFDARWGGRKTSEHRTTELITKERWLRTTTSPADQSIVHWRDRSEQGVFTKAFRLGRIRQLNPQRSGPEESMTFSPAAAPWSQTPLHKEFLDYDVELQHQGDRIILTMSMRDRPDHQTRLTIDSTRHVVLRIERLNEGAITSRTDYSQFANVGGDWWPGRQETFDDRGRRTLVVDISVSELSEESFSTKFHEELSLRDSTLFLREPLPSVRQAEVAVRQGAAGLEERLVLMLRSAWIQKWDDVFEQLNHLEKLAEGRSGLDWIRVVVLRTARRNDDVRQRLDSLSDELITGRIDDYFLARHLLTESSRASSSQEQLDLLDRLQPVFARLPEYASGLRDWQVRRVPLLRSLSQHEEYLALQKVVAENAPWDVHAQTQYARDLAAAGEIDQAYQWLRNELDRDAERHAYETGQLRRVYSDLLQQQSRTDELVEFLKEWVDAGSEDQQLYAEYLTALVLADRETEADTLAAQWLADGRIEGELAAARFARFNAALSFALGQRHQYSLSYVLPEWLKPLAETAEFFLKHEHHFSVARRILDSYYFRQTDEYDALVDDVSQILLAEADTLPTDALTAMVGWSLPASELSVEQWLDIAETLQRRWNPSEDAEKRQPLGQVIVRILRSHSPGEKLLPFMRQRISRAKELNQPRNAAAHRRELFNELLARNWSEDHEVEAFGLLDDLSVAETTAEQVIVQVEALHRLVDAMLRARFKASMTALLDKGHPEELTRTELEARQSEFQQAARTGLADRLAAETTRRNGAGSRDEVAADSNLNDWLNVERLFLEVSADRNTDQAIAECWKILGEQPVPPLSEDELAQLDENTIHLLILEDMRKTRAMSILMNAAARRSAPENLRERVLKYTDTAIEQATDSDGEGFTWKNRMFELLVALDRPKDLERHLERWISADDYKAPWQLALGRLLAEQGRIEEAILLFETVEQKSPLSPADYETLSNWYLVEDRRDKYDQARIDAFHVMRDHEIRNWIQQQLNPWRRRDTTLPSELDARVLSAFIALFQKSQRPEDYVSLLRSFYQACGDFRLLKGIPDIVTGRSPQQVYPLLKELDSLILGEIRDEATADEIVDRIETLRATVESAIDLRALDLLEVIVERKSSELMNQPGPHADAALSSLKRAIDREWADGEPRLMADFLAALGNIPQTRLADEQMRQLETLHHQATPGTDDRLHIAYSLANGHFNSYGRREQGLAVMENAIREYEQSHPEGWPLHASEPLSGYVNFLEQVSRFAQAEELLDRFLKSPANPAIRNWLLNRQNQVFREALQSTGRVSLGEGKTLYVALIKRIKGLIENADAPFQYTLLTEVVRVYRAANDLQLKGVHDDLRVFAFQQFPRLLKSQTHQYRNLVNLFARALSDINGPRDALAFLMARVESWPQSMRHNWQDAWSQCGHDLARWWHETDGKARDLEPRLLDIVLTELRRSLTTRQRRSSYFFRKHYSYYWSDKESEFARVAEEVLSERPDSSRTVNHVSEYLWNGLEHYARAIEIRLIAHRKGLLAPADLYQLVTWLHHQKRWAEAIPILEPLVNQSPDEMQYRTALLISYARSSRPEDRDRLLAETDEHFRRGGRWTESNIALLASTCVEVHLDPAAVKYYGELIPLAQRSRPDRGVGEGTVSHYYQQLSESHARLGNTKDAVDAASAAVIAWGPRHDQRTSAINQLNSVVRRAQELSRYVDHLDRQLAETGQDSPLIRRVIGEVFAERGQHEDAIAQLQLAAELQPFDRETHQALVRSYDALKDSRSAVDQILKQLDFDRHNLDLYKELAKRLKGDERQSERAVTTLVEAAPKEAEHHEALAVIRQEQNRWGEAINHWKNVASLRALEPTGLLKLAEAQIHEERWSAALTTIGKLKARTWPSRFSNIESQIRQLEQQIKP